MEWIVHVIYDTPNVSIFNIPPATMTMTVQRLSELYVGMNSDPDATLHALTICQELWNLDTYWFMITVAQSSASKASAHQICVSKVCARCVI